MTKPKKPSKRPWWKFWTGRTKEPAKEIAYDRTAHEQGTTRTK
jgi:hypothetical protein